MDSFEGCKLELAYPCRWQYKAIGPDKSMLEQALAEIFADCQCDIQYSNASKTGKYHSFEVDIEVSDEQSRLGYYQLLKAHVHIIMVM